MSNLLPIIVIVGIGIVLVALTRRGVLSQRRAHLTLQSREASGPDRELVLRILRAIRTRNLTAVGAAVLGIVLAVVVHQGFTKAAGLPSVLAPGAAGVLSTLVFLWWPLPHEAGSTSQLKHDQICADLTPRTKGMFGPGWGSCSSKRAFGNNRRGVASRRHFFVAGRARTLPPVALRHA